MNPLLSIGRFLMILGGGFVLVGGLLYILARLGINFTWLPGDIRVQTGNVTCVFALGASILLSLLLTLALNIIVRFLNR